MKIRIYLKSGNNIDVECEKFEYTFDGYTGNFTSYTITKPTSDLKINPIQIEAWQSIN